MSRGINCTADQVIIVTGAQAALDLVSRVLMDEGDHVWMEEPGYLGAKSAFLASGAQARAAQGRPARLEPRPTPTCRRHG